MTAAIEYTEDIAAVICGRLADGESLKAICLTEGVPSKKVVYKWLATKPDFLALYTQAREDQADTLADEILEIADDRSRDLDDKGKVDRDVIDRARLRVDSRKWIASKLKPKKYGDKLAIGGAEDLPPLDAIAFNDRYPRAQQAYFAVVKAKQARDESQLMLANLTDDEKHELEQIFRRIHPDIASAIDEKNRLPLQLEATQLTSSTFRG